jgi:translation elongation factor EF-Ts|tara:strand:- start:11188 stop:11412 length:225 start_codon:yes stop_codon:yes gene_type:complete
MTSAKALAQMSGHAERDCADVLDACGGDVDRAIDRLLNSACDETARTGERGAANARATVDDGTMGDRGPAAFGG